MNNKTLERWAKYTGPSERVHFRVPPRLTWDIVYKRKWNELSIAQAETLTGISRARWVRQIKDGRIPAFLFPRGQAITNKNVPTDTHGIWWIETDTVRRIEIEYKKCSNMVDAAHRVALADKIRNISQQLTGHRHSEN